MPGFVLDSSVALSWFLPGENPNNSLLEKIIENEIFVPRLWYLEVTNVILMAQKHQRINQIQKDKILEEIRLLPVKIDHESINFLWNKTLKIAEDSKLTIYDSEYLELAQRLNLPLATYDKDLSQAARQYGLSVIH